MSIRILLADDHQILLDALRRLLSGEDDMEVVGEAKDGHSVLKLAATLRPDVVVMDISMPGMNGIEATQLLSNEYPEIRVIGLSSYNNRPHIMKMLEAGAAGYITKENSSDELLCALRAVMKRQRYLCPEAAKIIAENTKHSPMPSVPRLGPREREVLQLVAKGDTSQIIASNLFISVSTVDVHRRNIMKKLDLHNVAALTTYAIRNGIINI
jgi:DNA-binding NarL/FixJ family response regulator